MELILLLILVYCMPQYFVVLCFDKSSLTLTDYGDNVHDADDQAAVLMSATFKRHVHSNHTNH